MSGFAEIVRSSHYSPVFRLCMYTEVCWEKNSTLIIKKRKSSSTIYANDFSNLLQKGPWQKEAVEKEFFI